MRQTWEEKPIHGQYPARVNKRDVGQENNNNNNDTNNNNTLFTEANINYWLPSSFHYGTQEKTYQCLRSSGLKSETEGLIIAAQDQSLATKSYHHKIIKDDTDPKCRMCKEFEETIDHISGCTVLAKTEYIQRHDHLPTAGKWYDHIPETVTENESATILWNMPVTTDKQINANRPDTIVMDKKANSCLMIDMTIPSERNVSIKQVEKLSKYKDLKIEVAKNVENEDKHRTSCFGGTWFDYKSPGQIHQYNSRTY